MQRREFINIAAAGLVSAVATPTWACTKTKQINCVLSAQPSPVSTHRFKGVINMPLTIVAKGCHPDFDKLKEDERWYSLGIAAQGKLNRFIERVRSKKPVDEIIIEGKACIEQFVPKGARLIVVTPCRVPDKFVFLVTDEIHRSGEYEFHDFNELRKYAYSQALYN